MFTRKIFNLSNLVLVVALTLSVIAAWYSILGLVAIFAASVLPIIIMGSALEVAKVVTTVWLHRYWNNITWLYKVYLVPAVIVLAIITSMGIFGFLSKAHTDQNLVSGDVQAKIALYDEKIKIAKENIDANRRSLKQMDEAVDQTMGRSTTEQGADKAVQVRRSQARERTRLLSDIEAEQKKITELNEARAPIAAEVRKVEAEVGPIKYIAALIYGDNPEANLLERAVRWVIILLVLVFDPLALVLVVASNNSRKWEFTETIEKTIAPTTIEPEKINDTQPISQVITDPIQEEKQEPVEEIKETANNPIEQIYLKKPWIDKIVGIRFPPQVYKPTPKIPEVINCSSCDIPLEQVKGFGLICPNLSCSLGTSVLTEPIDVIEPVVEPNIEVSTTTLTTDDQKIQTEGITKAKPFKQIDGDYIIFDDKAYKKEAFQSLYPEYFRLTKDNYDQPQTKFGSQFPKMSGKGDIFIRVDVLPNRLFKFDGIRWIEINKNNTNSYMYDQAYLEYLVKKIELGEYDVDLLSENEKQLIEQYLSNQKT